LQLAIVLIIFFFTFNLWIWHKVSKCCQETWCLLY